MTADELKAIVVSCCETFNDPYDRYSFYRDLIRIVGLKESELAMGIDTEFDEARDEMEPS